VNLIGHQKAAYEILTELFTPQTIMQSDTHRKICTWYIRFDVVAGILAGYEMVLGREWFVACTDFYTLQAQDRPNDLGAIFEERIAKSRLLATDIALLFNRKAKNVLSDEAFATGVQSLGEQLVQVEHDISAAFEGSREYVKEFPGAPAEDLDPVTDWKDPNFLLAGDLFTWNFIKVDFLAIVLMYKSWMAGIDKSQPPHEIVDVAFRICKVFEAMQYASGNDDAVVLGAQASLGLAATCLPKDEKHTMWCRRKFARIESSGLVVTQRSCFGRLLTSFTVTSTRTLCESACRTCGTSMYRDGGCRSTKAILQSYSPYANSLFTVRGILRILFRRTYERCEASSVL